MHLIHTVDRRQQACDRSTTIVCVLWVCPVSQVGCVKCALRCISPAVGDACLYKICSTSFHVFEAVPIFPCAECTCNKVFLCATFESYAHGSAVTIVGLFVT